ncbi:Lrp/AsnC ligand binding domain-containing protein [Candidatus Woesearchaeota archaeon]|nr:Lrp/AsnC ligand binding domain-containing protein [Candidatus Woesearchaeota archaeon]
MTMLGGETMKSFVLIAMKEGGERELLQELSGFPEVEDVHILFGEWDILAEVNVSSAEELGTFIMDKVRSRGDVRLTSSLIVAGR